MTTTIAHTIRPFAAGAALIAASLSLSGCFSISTDFGGETLDELDKGGDAPTEIGLAGPDNLVVKTGKKLKIKVEGDDDAVEALRFKRSGDSLTVGREGDWNKGMSKATVTITMPAPTDISMAGSGDITAQSLADNAEISMAGSGSVRVAEVDASSLEISSAGSGSITAAGRAQKLDVSIMGSGSVDLADLNADDVEVSIAGSGSVKVASDGQVEASIAGSGSVYVEGSATCTASTAGSGSLTCKQTTVTTTTSTSKDE
ncbi:MAG: head GIN domain-containing protein [Pseudomonadota bacterium]